MGKGRVENGFGWLPFFRCGGENGKLNASDFCTILRILL